MSVQFVHRPRPQSRGWTSSVKFAALGALALMSVWGQAGAASAAQTITLDLTQPNPNLVFSNAVASCSGCAFTPGGDAYVSYSAAGATIGDPAKSAGEGFRNDVGGLLTTFKVLGDFTATVTFDDTLLNQSLTGSGSGAPFTIDELEAGFTSTSLALIGQNGHASGDTTFGACFFSPTCIQTHTDAANNGLGQVMSISRVGNVVTMTEGPLGLPNAEVFQGSGFGTGPAFLDLAYSSMNDSPGANSITFETFSITADGFQGLATGVPEPGAWLLMIAGLFGLGAALRSQRARRASAIPA
jgi:hypothetical protein